jgi:putative chitinase
VRRIAPEWNHILLYMGVKPTTAAIWSEIFAAVVQRDTFSQGDRELDDFLSQVLHESCMLERLEERLHYSTERLMAVWPRRFPTLAAALPYAANAEGLANHVYAPGTAGSTAAGA